MATRTIVTTLFALTALGAILAAQQVTKQTVEGVANFARLETTVACAGATKPEAVPEIKKMGFAAIINLRDPSEAGANVDAEAAAAQTAGIKFFNVPFNGTSPDPKTVERFLDVIKSPGVEPAFIHCAGGNRAAAMWLAKRIAIDHWDTERATAEATALGLTSATLKQFIIEYAQGHKR